VATFIPTAVKTVKRSGWCVNNRPSTSKLQYPGVTLSTVYRELTPASRCLLIDRCKVGVELFALETVLDIIIQRSALCRHNCTSAFNLLGRSVGTKNCEGPSWNVIVLDLGEYK